MDLTRDAVEFPGGELVMTAIAPYQSQAPTGRDRFGRLVRAEWTKFRTVRGWVIAILLAPLLIVAVGFLTRSGCSMTGANGQSVACPAPPTGPGGEAVVDSFYFVHQALTGNGTITVRVASLTGQYPASSNGGVLSGGGKPGVQPWSKAGIMVSASTAQGSAYAAMMVTGDNGARMQWNYTGDSPGLPGAVSAVIAALAAPDAVGRHRHRVRLARRHALDCGEQRGPARPPGGRAGRAVRDVTGGPVVRASVRVRLQRGDRHVR